MEGSHIYEGDLIYVQQCNTVASGTISVVLIGEEATVKKGAVTDKEVSA